MKAEGKRESVETGRPSKPLPPPTPTRPRTSWRP